MYRWYGLDEVPEGWGQSVVTIGVFDGVHRGHQRDLAREAEIGRQLSLPVVAVTFDPHPDEVVEARIAPRGAVPRTPPRRAAGRLWRGCRVRAAVHPGVLPA